jgi:hypothetical protein
LVKEIRRRTYRRGGLNIYGRRTVQNRPWKRKYKIIKKDGKYLTVFIDISDEEEKRYKDKNVHILLIARVS